MSYLTFDEYTEKGGALDSAAFSKCIGLAEAKLNAMTPLVRHPLTVTEAVKQATAFLIDNYAAPRLAGDGKVQEVASFSNDGVTVSLSTKSEQDKEKDLYDVVHTLLPHETRLGVRIRC